MGIGFIGLGRMGSNMVLNLLEHGHEVVVYNRSLDKVRDMEKKGAIGSVDYLDFAQKLGRGRKVVWIMVTANAVNDVLLDLLLVLKKGDIIIDGGNSYYENSVKLAKELKRIGINLLDVGVSGGIDGARKGACMMVGGEKIIYTKLKKFFSDMCVKNGFGYMGKSGAGHFVKGVHNAIEYGVLGAFNEGFDVLKKERRNFGIDLKEVAKVYDNGSIIEGKISGWVNDVFSNEKYLDELSCQVPPGETEKEMSVLEKKYDMKVLRQARLMRKKSRTGDFCGNLIAGVRNKFGGHGVLKK